MSNDFINKCYIEAIEAYAGNFNANLIVENMGYKVFGKLYPTYSLYISKDSEKASYSRLPKFSEINKKNISTFKLHNGLFIQNLKDNNEIEWMYTSLVENSVDTIIFGKDFCLARPGYVNNTNYMAINLLCKDDSVAERLCQYLVAYEEPINKCFNYITAYQGGFGHTTFDLPSELKIPLLNYMEDFPWIELKDFCESDTPGAFFLYGTPGCGKSMAIRKLIMECNTEFFVLDSSILNNITSAAFVDYLTDECANSVLILEDCETLLKSRDSSFNPFMSTILNLTDGLLGDGLKLKFICTFNTDINQIDSALLRKGRLKGKYEFKKLPKDKANKVCESLNLPLINKEATLAEIYNQEENDFSKKTVKKIGF